MSLIISTDPSLENDENYFKFKIIFATGAKVDMNYKYSESELFTFDMFPTYISFDDSPFVFQQILTYGSTFSVEENEMFFANKTFNKKNKYYFTHTHYKNWQEKNHEHWNDPHNSLKYYDLGYSSSLSDEDIMKIAIDPTCDFVVEPKNVTPRDLCILKTINNTDFVEQIKKITCGKKMQQMSNFYEDDIYGHRCKITFSIAVGYIKF